MAKASTPSSLRVGSVRWTFDPNPTMSGVEGQNERVQGSGPETLVLERLAEEHGGVVEVMASHDHRSFERCSEDREHPVVGPVLSDHAGIRCQRIVFHLVLR